MMLLNPIAGLHLFTRLSQSIERLKSHTSVAGNRVATAASGRKSPMYIIAKNITGPRLRCEALMVDKKTYTAWPPEAADGWRRAYKFRDRLKAEVVRLELDPMGTDLKVIEAVYIP
jgi:hypothetical protein